MTYSIFSTLNDSLLINYSITTVLFGIIAYLVLFFISYGIADIKAQRKAERAKLDSIPYMSWNELRSFAKANNIKVSRTTTKVALQNILIMSLA